MPESLIPDANKHAQVISAFKHALRTILLKHLPGKMRKRRNARPLCKLTKKLKPKICVLGSQKMEFFPLPALNEEESSVGGTIRVVEKIFTTLLGLAVEIDEHRDEFSAFLCFDWVQESAMPFHFQLNAIIVLGKRSVSDLKVWTPSCAKFESVVDEVITKYATTAAAQDALKAGDEVLAHSILFIQDSLFFWEFCDAVCDADVGQMWVVYDFWIFMMRGAGCHNYGNKILEMKAQFQYEFPQILCEVVERTWLVNRWGKKGHSILTDLYLEHNNGFTKEKSSACVEVLQKLAYEMSSWFASRDFNHKQSEVSIHADIAALCLDLSMHKVHSLSTNRKIQSTMTQKKIREKKNSPVHDVLLEGMKMLIEKGMYGHWLKRMGVGGTDLYGSDPEVGMTVEMFDEIEVEGVFGDPDGRMEVDPATDLYFGQECPFSNVNINSHTMDS
ncbi:hypothetical protein BYT27DRAFT_7253682 [Phlegmacium glaucopus]|nr:hypothetical protein BYT27DRAFT_7253682 [Phlegmacium glaucopus]